MQKKRKENNDDLYRNHIWNLKKTNRANEYDVNDLMQSTYTRILSEFNYLDGGKNYQPIHRVELPTCLY